MSKEELKSRANQPRKNLKNAGNATFYSSLYFPKIESNYMDSTFNDCFMPKPKQDENNNRMMLGDEVVLMRQSFISFKDMIKKTKPNQTSSFFHPKKKHRYLGRMNKTTRDGKFDKYSPQNCIISYDADSYLKSPNPHRLL